MEKIVRQSRSCGDEEQRKNIVAVCCDKDIHDKLKDITEKTELAKGIIVRTAILKLLRGLENE